MIIFYNAIIFLYQLLIRAAALRNAKAKAWIEGRRNLHIYLKNLSTEHHPRIWVHCASTGEFEQAKPVIEAIKKQFSHYRIIASFFSPSGFEAAEKYAHIDYRCYLPIDTSHNAQQFVALINPQLVIFSKYDFWYHHINTIKNAGIPLLLISSIFRKNQVFFKWYGGFYKAILQQFSHLFVQDSSSVQLLNQHGIHHCSISGDTRFDRVLTIAAAAATRVHPSIAFAQAFIQSQHCIVAGSTWADDEKILAEVQHKFPDTKYLIVPHELHEAHLNELGKIFPNALRLSSCMATLEKQNENGVQTTMQLPQQWLDAPVLIVDAMGLLSRLYALATITYVGGGFTRDGIHNTLEAAVWGKPVLIGPNYKKYREAKELIAAGGAYSITDAEGLQQRLATLLHNEAALKAASDAAENYVRENGGATDRILHYIQENRLLTKL